MDKLSSDFDIHVRLIFSGIFQQLFFSSHQFYTRILHRTVLFIRFFADSLVARISPGDTAEHE